MTLPPLAHDFPLRSPLGVRHPHIVPVDEQLAEAEAELARRTAPTGYPRRVARDQMTAPEAERHIALLAAIVQDLRVTLRPAAPRLDARDFPWEAKVRELRRELAIRRSAYPKWIEKPAHPLTPAEAAARSEAFDAIHWRYWALLDHFAGRGDRAHDFGGALDSFGAIAHHAQRVAWIAECEAHAVRRDPANLGDATPDGADPALPWQSLAALARAAAQGACPLDTLAPPAITRLARHVRARLDAVLFAHADPGTAAAGRLEAEAHRFATADRWMLRVEAWFGARETDPPAAQAA